jgi:hypothetical protein
MNDFVSWAAAEAERSNVFRVRIGELKEKAKGAHRGRYSRTTGPLTDYTWSELGELELEGRESGFDRPRGWKEDRNRLATDEGNRHIRDYRKGCRAVAGAFLGNKDLGERVHEHVRGKPLHVLPRGMAPTGGVASTLAAHLTGASWGSGATANRQAWYYHRSNTFKLL